MTTDTAPATARHANVTASHTALDVCAAISARRGANGGRKSQISWRALARQIGMPGAAAMLARVAAGKQQPSPRLFVALGLTPPVVVVEVPAGFGVGRACAVCGQVHTTKTCTARRRTKTRPVLKRWGIVRYGDQPGRDGDRI